MTAPVETLPEPTTIAAPSVARRPPPPEPEPELLRRVRARDRAAFERLHAHYSGFVHAVATRFDPRNAADISQEVFFRLWQQIDRFEERARFSSWLFRVVANAALDSVRRVRRRAESPLDALASIPLSPASEVDTDERLDLAAAVAALSPRLRLPLVLRFYGGLDYEEIGRALALRPGTVASRLSRALEKLARHLEAGAPGASR